MDLIDALNRISSRIPQQLPMLQTEEATKNALVMLLINALGYNVFDPLEVVPEYTADVGIKKGEKVDYAIILDGKPMILIECKSVGSKLELKHASQLYRYFSVTEARFVILTDGIEYLFYSDLESPNKMDEKPFFEFSMTSIEQLVADELKKFSKSNFDLDNILSGASELKYRKQIKRLIAEQYDSPSEELVRLFTSKVISGRFTSEIKTQFTNLVKQAFREFVRDQVSTRFKSALEDNDTSDNDTLEGESPESPGDDGIVTTEEETEAFHIVRAILSKSVDPDRVVMRDTKSYCGVLLDDNNRKPICRLRFNSSNLYVGFFDESRSEVKIAIERPTDIYQHESKFISVLSLYESESDTE